MADVVQLGGKNGRDFEQDEYILESLNTEDDSKRLFQKLLTNLENVDYLGRSS